MGFGFFVPIFFIGVGAEFQLDVLRNPAVLTSLALLFVLSLVAKALGAIPLALSPFTPRDGAGASGAYRIDEILDPRKTRPTVIRHLEVARQRRKEPLGPALMHGIKP